MTKGAGMTNKVQPLPATGRDKHHQLRHHRLEACATEACATEACATEACATEACATEACATTGRSMERTKLPFLFLAFIIHKSLFLSSLF